MRSSQGACTHQDPAGPGLQACSLYRAGNRQCHDYTTKEQKIRAKGSRTELRTARLMNGRAAYCACGTVAGTVCAPSHRSHVRPDAKSSFWGLSASRSVPFARAQIGLAGFFPRGPIPAGLARTPNDPFCAVGKGFRLGSRKSLTWEFHC